MIKNKITENFNIELVDWLSEMGWDLECESPLEIYHEESNSYATGIAATSVISKLENEYFEIIKSRQRCIDCGKPSMYVRENILGINKSTNSYFCKEHALAEPQFNEDNENQIWNRVEDVE